MTMMEHCNKRGQGSWARLADEAYYGALRLLSRAKYRKPRDFGALAHFAGREWLCPSGYALGRLFWCCLQAG
ncbi:hypothetical protein N7457_002689 [Penicillium paradoxum]|uniref:uncharacterized protein n=1 Tax=Penicillium paradoxum TaxID=176176 RepID=UPI0025499F9A|nr:uncharacterized protein N7457_002689 [Penicillium paradoxum]KAJ5787699.1 hypothetical protein N7457_002689 [Penicillium paradoxum]